MVLLGPIFGYAWVIWFLVPQCISLYLHLLLIYQSPCYFVFSMSCQYLQDQISSLVSAFQKCVGFFFTLCCQSPSLRWICKDWSYQIKKIINSISHHHYNEAISYKVFRPIICSQHLCKTTKSSKKKKAYHKPISVTLQWAIKLGILT